MPVAFLELVKQTAEVDVAGENSETELRVFVALWKEGVRVEAASLFQSNCQFRNCKVEGREGSVVKTGHSKYLKLCDLASFF